ncbi:MAG: isocitrate lyase/phosphoenolpyruvate mutase family protein [Tetrasphaera sp.]
MDTPITRDRFRALHESGLFIMPNPFDVGSAKQLAAAGYSALATTSSGFAATIGKADHEVTRDDLVAHVAALAAAVDVPINVDAEVCYPDEPGGVVETIDRLAQAGAAGVSIEDYIPGEGFLRLDEATNRVSVAAAAAARHGVVLTARAEAFLHDNPDIDETMHRLAAYRDAGADVLYAPGIVSSEQIAAVVSLGLPVNVLALAGQPTRNDLESLGVRRISTGGALTRAAYAAALAAAPPP